MLEAQPKTVARGPVTTNVYQLHLAELDQRLHGHAGVQFYLTGTGLCFDGAELSMADPFELSFG